MTHQFEKASGTTPVTNIIQLNRGWMDEYLRRQMAVYDQLRGSSIVASHKQLFGRQTYCWTGSRRYWVWEFPKTGLRLFVANGMGVGPEVLESLSGEQAMDAMRSYWNTVGV